MSREPETEAGRALWAWAADDQPVQPDDWYGAILEIERQAEAELRRSLAEKVRALPYTDMGWRRKVRGDASQGTYRVYSVERDPVLRLIEGSDPASPEPPTCNHFPGQTVCDWCRAATPVAGSTIPPLDPEWQALSDAATPGPWDVYRTGAGDLLITTPTGHGYVAEMGGGFRADNEQADAVYIVALVNWHRARLAGSTETVTEEPR